MRKKVIAKRAPREKIYKPPTKPSTRSQDRTFTPSPSPPTSPPRCDPMARTKNTPRFPASAKPTPLPKATPSKPASSKPGSLKPPSSKGKRPATEEPVPEPQQPRARSVPVRSQRGNTRVSLKNVKEPEIGPFDHKAHFMTSHSNYNPYRFKSAMNNDFYEGVIQYRTLCSSFLADLPSLKRKEFYANMTYHEGTAHSYVKGRDIILNNETISEALKYTDVGPCAYTDVAQEFVSQSNHLIELSKEKRKLASKHENFLKKSRDRVAVLMTFINNLQNDEDVATDVEEDAVSEGNGSDA
nr:anther-specific proline-rich protein APG-like [Arachis hypogaea]